MSLILAQGKSFQQLFINEYVNELNSIVSQPLNWKD